MRFINPLSNKSGIQYFFKETKKEKIDQLVYDEIKYYWDKPLTFWQAMKKTFDIIVGQHYNCIDMATNYHHEDHIDITSKGLLDFLIFPLISRKIMNHFERKGHVLSLLGILLATPFEAIRVGLGGILTFIASPIVFTAHLIKSKRTMQLKQKVLDLQVECQWSVDDVLKNTLRKLENGQGIKHTVGEWRKSKSLGRLLEKKHLSIDNLADCIRISMQQNGEQVFNNNMYKFLMNDRLFPTVFRVSPNQMEPQALDAFNSFKLR